MAQLFLGSLNLTKMLAQARDLHSAFKKAENGDIWVNTKTWLNDDPDKYGNTMSHQLNSSKDNAEKEGNVYIGNSKPTEQKERAITDHDIDQLGSDLPF